MDALADSLSTMLQAHSELKLALLFGSRGNGRARIDSDIDLAVLGHAPLSTDTLITIIGDVGAAFGLPVDLIDLHGTPEPVTGEALKGVRLFGDNDTYADLIGRHLINVEDFIPLQRRMMDERLARWLH